MQSRDHHRQRTPLDTGHGVADRGRQHRMRRQLHKHPLPLGQQRGDALTETDRLAQLAHPIIRRTQLLGGGDLPGQIRHHRHRRRRKPHPGSHRGELRQRRIHQRRMKPMTDPQPSHHQPRRPTLGLHRGDLIHLPRDHHRRRPIDRSDPHPRKALQQTHHLSLSSADRQHRPHRAGLHQPPPLRHQPRRIRQREHPRQIRRGQLPHRMPHQHIRTDPSIGQHRRHAHPEREQRRLGIGGLGQQPRRLTVRVGEHHLPQRHRQIPIQRRTHLIDRVGEHPMLPIQLNTHPRVLRPLPRQHEHHRTGRLTGQVMLHHPHSRAPSRQGPQPRHQPLPNILTGTASGDHRPIRMLGTRSGQTEPHIGHIHTRMPTQVLTQPLRLSAQRRRSPRRHRPHMQQRRRIR
ncbi:hypothetical protein MSIMFI_05533 [Mycobacterium simulans]|nr:hypothetical protein MSIMFI_05533 [Mycobacterium simulans]